MRDQNTPRASMPIFFSNSLEQSLHRAVALANEGRCEYATLEHLLLALIDDQDAAAAMRACNVDLEKLRRDLFTCIGSELDNLVTHGSVDAEPTEGFQHAIQYAVIHVQSSGRVQVTGADAIVAILADSESQAAGHDALEVTRYISYGIAGGDPVLRRREGGDDRKSPMSGLGPKRRFDVLRLMISRYLVGCSIGSSTGLAPFRIRST